MRTSDTIAKLAGALSKAQGKFKAASKDSVNPHFRNKYADLASIWDAIRDPLSANGLSVVQGVLEPNAHEHLGPQWSGPKAVGVVTTLMHESGEWIQSSVWIPVGTQNAQGVGSAITYGRRYGLTALVGITQDDDDGESAVGRGPMAAKPSTKPAAQVDIPALIQSISEAKDLDSLKGIWTSAMAHSTHAEFGSVLKAKEDAKARLSTAVPAKVAKAVKAAAPAAPAEINEDDVPFA
jgi:hypothetical protein